MKNFLSRSPHQVSLKIHCIYFSFPKCTHLAHLAHAQSLSADTGQDQANRQGRLSLWTMSPAALGQPHGLLGYVGRERGRGGKEREGGRVLDGGFRKSVRDIQTRARETDSGRRRHRLSISGLWTLSAVLPSLFLALYISVNLDWSSAISLSLSV